MNDKRTETARALVGQVLWDRTKLNEPIVNRVTADDMPPGWAKVWQAIRDGGMDAARIAFMLDAETAQAVGGEIGIAETLVFGGGEYANEYARRLLAYTARLKMRDLARRILAETEGETDPNDIAYRAIDNFASMSIDAAHELESLGDITRDVISDIEAMRKNPREIWGIPTGLPKLDKLTGGQHKGEWSLLMGEPGVGKTWLALGMAVDMSAAEPGAVISMEMKRRAVGRRILAGYSGVSSRAMKSGFIDDAKMQKVYSAKNDLEKMPVYLSDKSFTTSDLRAMLGRAKSKYGIGWAIIDYMMLFQDSAKDETQFTAHVSRALKNISIDLDLAVICVHSVTKVGMDGDNDPTKSQARGSGQVLHDADLIMHITKFKAAGSLEQSAALKYGDKLATMWITKGRELEDAKNRNHLCRRGDSPFWGELDMERK